MADGTGVKQQRSRKCERRAVIGITKGGCVEPLGSFTNTEWPGTERNIKERIKGAEPYNIPLRNVWQSIYYPYFYRGIKRKA